MIKNLFIIIAVSLNIISCDKEDEQPLDLQGRWQEQTDFKKGYFEGKSRTYAFNCNSFFLTRYSFTDAIQPDDSCSKSNWNEYATGSYSLDKNVLELDGFYTDSLFNRKTSGCFNIGAFKDRFLVDYNGQVLKLSPVNQTDEMKFLKEEKLTCSNLK